MPSLHALLAGLALVCTRLLVQSHGESNVFPVGCPGLGDTRTGNARMTTATRVISIVSVRPRDLDRRAVPGER